MTENTLNQAQVPYSNTGGILLNCIFKGLEILCKNYIEKLKNDSIPEIKSTDDALKGIFDPFLKAEENKERGINPHFQSGNTKNDNYDLRITRVLIQCFKEVTLDSKNQQGFCIPSPLYILNTILTVPEEPQTSAYALIYCRSFLFETFKVYPKHPLLSDNYESFDIVQINSHLDTFKSYTSQHNNIPLAETLKSQLTLAHFLAAKGILYLRFGAEPKLKSKTKNEELLATHDETNIAKEDYEQSNDLNKVVKSKLKYSAYALKYLSAMSFNPPAGLVNKITFHKNSIFEELPDPSSLMNELAGVPIPIRGAETVFQGGLKSDSHSNLVIRISGDAGCGKTSYALALSAVLSPLNTFTYYMSLEEDAQDLGYRLQTLIPSYLKKLSIYNKNVDDWFLADKIKLGENNKLKYFEEEYLSRITNKLNTQTAIGSNTNLPAVCPLVIVIDSVRMLLDEQNSNLEYFIELCKKLKAIIILISASDEKYHQEIDYLVDVVISLKHFGTNSQKEKPVRILHLSKTRHQVSRPGSHIFHLSGEKGFRISPQLPSQIDKKERIVKPIPSNFNYISYFADNIKNNDLYIWDTSQILIHGNGSSGKSGLALSILLSPLRNKDIFANSKNITSYKRKILVISLLYPSEYYQDIKKRILKNNLEEWGQETNIDLSLDCLYFYSGYITPEDFIARILRKLDEAILDGDPFQGILLDGLHNVSLQFHKLQESDMVWPTLYSLLSKYRLMILTTFTNFQIDSEGKHGSYDDDEILLKGHKPLLHALVQATDYHFGVSSLTKHNTKKASGQFLITLKSAIKYKNKGQKYVWDRETLKISEYTDTFQLSF